MEFFLFRPNNVLFPAKCVFFHGPLKVSANDSLLFLGNQGENRQLFIANLPLNASKELRLFKVQESQIDCLR